MTDEQLKINEIIISSLGAYGRVVYYDAITPLPAKIPLSPMKTVRRIKVYDTREIKNAETIDKVSKGAKDKYTKNIRSFHFCAPYHFLISKEGYIFQMNKISTRIKGKDDEEISIGIVGNFSKNRISISEDGNIVKLPTSDKTISPTKAQLENLNILLAAFYAGKILEKGLTLILQNLLCEQHGDALPAIINAYNRQILNFNKKLKVSADLDKDPLFKVISEAQIGTFSIFETGIQAADYNEAKIAIDNYFEKIKGMV